MKGVIKNWICFLFKIPRTFIVTYETDGKKILVIIETAGKNVDERRFQVEHLIDDNLSVTKQTLDMEKKMFVKLSSNK